MYRLFPNKYIVKKKKKKKKKEKRDTHMFTLLSGFSVLQLVNVICNLIVILSAYKVFINQGQVVQNLNEVVS